MLSILMAWCIGAGIPGQSAHDDEMLAYRGIETAAVVPQNDVIEPWDYISGPHDPGPITFCGYLSGSGSWLCDTVPNSECGVKFRISTPMGPAWITYFRDDCDGYSGALAYEDSTTNDRWHIQNFDSASMSFNSPVSPMFWGLPSTSETEYSMEGEESIFDSTTIQATDVLDMYPLEGCCGWRNADPPLHTEGWVCFDSTNEECAIVVITDVGVPGKAMRREFTRDDCDGNLIAHKSTPSTWAISSYDSATASLVPWTSPEVPEGFVADDPLYMEIPKADVLDWEIPGEEGGGISCAELIAYGAIIWCNIDEEIPCYVKIYTDIGVSGKALCRTFSRWECDNKALVDLANMNLPDIRILDYDDITAQIVDWPL